LFIRKSKSKSNRIIKKISLKANPDKIDWPTLSSNPNPEAIDLLKENQDKIDWDALSENPSAIELLKENQDRIDWEALSANPAIFEEVLE